MKVISDATTDGTTYFITIREFIVGEDYPEYASDSIEEAKAELIRDYSHRKLIFDVCRNLKKKLILLEKLKSFIEE